MLPYSMFSLNTYFFLFIKSCAIHKQFSWRYISLSTLLENVTGDDFTNSLGRLYWSPWWFPWFYSLCLHSVSTLKIQVFLVYHWNYFILFFLVKFSSNFKRPNITRKDHYNKENKPAVTEERYSTTYLCSWNCEL